jgi:hypothetical protein
VPRISGPIELTKIDTALEPDLVARRIVEHFTLPLLSEADQHPTRRE